MLRLSPNVRAIPKVAFTPSRPSQFQIRKQPKELCLSTIECIHHVIDRYVDLRGVPCVDRAAGGGVERPHDALLDVFQHLVRQQLGFVDVERDMRHRTAKARRAEWRRLKRERRASTSPA